VTRSLDRLQQLGFAQRRRNPANGAQVLVDPTADGCAWVATVAKTLGPA
jgi:DNA-binding MarR family transcriptional regulator